MTSIPAQSVGMGHRIGFVKPNYDADLVVWDSHPLSVGATPLQVYIDGKATLNPSHVEDSLAKSASSTLHTEANSRTRKVLPASLKEEVCTSIRKSDTIVITGIVRSYLDDANVVRDESNLTAVIQHGKLKCLGKTEDCSKTAQNGFIMHLENGHVLPGLTALSQNLGLSEIATEDSTSDGSTDAKLDVLKPENVVHAKHGIHLEGKAFERAKIAGITKAVTAPTSGEGGGFLHGVSVGIRTSGHRGLLNGGIFQDDVALHIAIGQESRGEIRLLLQPIR